MHLTGRIYNKPEHRMTLEGILFRIRTGIPWRDLPRQFGEWNTVFRRFNLWSKKGVMMEIFQFLSRFNDPQWLFIDASIVKTHQDGANFSDIIRRFRLTESAKMHALLRAMNDKTCLSIERLRKNVMFSINKHECRIRWCSGTRQPSAVAII
ncbi:Transposase and inactivated derivatives [Escherichia coli]|nr:IS5-like element ISSod6 family transposase [Escherichia coli]CTT28258.1 Transposase and inactivated derivatives [Escherichia coli]CTY30089.1 Transposase and inactivated derivatives [Escherichia coli]CTZ35627.1 Transposase and inactivated derivatives [Escherichia coli]CTZ82274.1 Transposase and inactivated derivatives [Escherichia coli]